MKMLILRFVNLLKLIPSGIGLVLGILLLIGGFGLVGWQVFLWLDEKIWHSYSLYTLLEVWLRSFPSEVILRNPGLIWFFQPNRLLGLHALLIWVLDFIPISLLLIIPGGFLTLFSLFQREDVKEKNAYALAQAPYSFAKASYALAKPFGFDDPTLVEVPHCVGDCCRCSGRLLYEAYFHLRFSINRITKNSLISDMEIDVEGEPYGELTKKFEVTLPCIRDKVFQLCPSFAIKNELFPALFVVCIGSGLYAIGPLKE